MNVVHRITAAQAAHTRTAVVDREMPRLRAYALLAGSDAFSITGSFLGVNLVFSWLTGAPMDHGLVMLSIILPLFGAYASMSGTYGAETLDDSRLGAKRAARALAISGAMLLFIAYMLKYSSGFSRGVFAIGFAVSFVLIILTRRMLSAPISQMLGGSAHTTVVISDSVDYRAKGSEVVLSACRLNFDPVTTDPRAYHLLAETVAHADRVIIACHRERSADWAAVLRTLGVDGEILTDLHDEVSAIGMREFYGLRTLVINYGPMTFSARVTKRAFDIIFSVLALIGLVPLMVSVAVAIKMESRGPIFFRQERIGRDNKIFRIFKFRSMYSDLQDEHAARLTQLNDDRVTKVGRFIRRTSIDELPQLLNVLKGEMSIVGPRPHALAAKAADLLYWDVDARYRQRHVIKPGLTGLAQIRGFRGNTQCIEDLTNRLQADLEYVAAWSLGRDLWIILRTLKVMSHLNAY